MDNFIYLIDNNLDEIFCDNLIKKYENDKNKYIGVVGRNGTINKELKNTTDLQISRYQNWKNEDTILCQALNKGINEYIDNILNNLTNINIFNINLNIFSKLYNNNDTGYKIQKYDRDKGYYNYHNDFEYSVKGVRVITFIWYLNDVEEGGETEFINGTIIKPKKGQLLLFPSDWTYMHKGNMPLSNDKYICNGWIYLNFNKDC